MPIMKSKSKKAVMKTVKRAQAKGEPKVAAAATAYTQAREYDEDRILAAQKGTRAPNLNHDNCSLTLVGDLGTWKSGLYNYGEPGERKFNVKPGTGAAGGYEGGGGHENG